jgi:hypothetical protein
MVVGRMQLTEKLTVAETLLCGDLVFQPFAQLGHCTPHGFLDWFSVSVTTPGSGHRRLCNCSATPPKSQSGLANNSPWIIGMHQTHLQWRWLVFT